MNEYQPNSHRYKEEQKSAEIQPKKVEKVIKGKAKVKTNELRKFADVFISEDVKKVKSYVLMDVLVPTIKKAIVDIVSDGVSMIFLGGSGRRGSSSGSSASKISYSSYYDRRDDRRHAEPVRSRYSYDDIILDSRSEAEEVLERMRELIETYNVASVADLYDLVGISTNHTDNKYGWTNLRNADVQPTRDGWVLRLPKALPID